jgi:hypothetical membrane protein
MTSKSNKIFFLAGIVGPVFYFLLLTILGSLWTGYNPILQSMSEIGSVVSPYKDTMNYFGFSMLGIFMALFGVGVIREFGKGIWQILAFFLVLVAGIFMFAVGFLPCDAGCVDVTQTGRWHSITSTVPSIALPLAAMILATVFAKRWSKKWGHISFWLGVFSMSSGPIMFIPSIAPYLGLAQRIGIGLSLLWMILISAKTLRE